MKKGWEEKKLGEVCEISTGNANTEDAVENGAYAFFDRSKVIKKSSTYLFDCEAIIIAGEGATFLPKFYSGKFNLHQRAYAIFNFSKNVNIQYAYKYLIYFHKYFEQVAVGATVKSLRLRHFQELPIPLPPLPEQQRIVAILDEAFAAIAKAKDNAEQNLKNAKELFESYLQGVFENKGEGWESKELMEVCEQITDGSHFSPKSSGEDEYPYITVRDIDEDIIDFDNCKFICKQDYQSLLKNGCKPNNGDLLFSKDGTVGKVSLVDFEKDFVVLSSLAIIRPKAKIITSSLLKYILKNPQFLQTAIGMKTGVAIRRIILKNLKLIEISFPKSLKEQQVIVQKLDALSTETQKLEAIYIQKIDDLEELKKSVLQKAFSGELKTKKVVAV